MTTNPESTDTQLIESLRGERDDLALKVKGLECEVTVLDQTNKRLHAYKDALVAAREALESCSDLVHCDGCNTEQGFDSEKVKLALRQIDMCSGAAKEGK